MLRLARSSRACARAIVFAALVSSASIATSCTEPFDPQSIVKAPRILAIVTDPPEAAPGEDVRVSTMVALPRRPPALGVPEIELRYRVCARLDEGLPGFAGMQYGAVQDDRGCREGAPFATDLETDEAGVATLPGSLTELAYRSVEAAAATYGELLPADTLALILDTTGLPLAIEVELRVDGVFVMRAFKRVLVTRHESRGTNPPAPRFQIDERIVSARGEGNAPFSCMPDGPRPVVRGGVIIELTPTRLDTEENRDAGVIEPDEIVDPDWRETFPVIDVQGELLEAREGAYYNWFATGGSFSREDTREPDPVTRWTPPRVSGETHRLWLVVRDGHAGTSACLTEVDVAM